jgi:hypothetical protein
VATVKKLDAEIIREPEAAGTLIERPDITRKDQGEAPVHPRTGGSPNNAPDTSKSSAGNRDPGPREAGKRRRGRQASRERES